MAATFRERSRHNTPSGRFSLDAAEYVRVYDLEEMRDDGSSHAPQTSEIVYWIRKLIGDTDAGISPRPLGSPGGAGTIDRTPPTPDPQFPGMFCSNVSLQIDGMEGYLADQNGLAQLLAIPPELRFARFNNVAFHVTYSPRPYAITDNSRMTMLTKTWYNFDGTATLVRLYPEAYRYTQFLMDDVDTRVSASQGAALEFRVPSNSPPGMDGAIANSIPDMIVPDVKLTVRHYSVPLRFLTSPNSHLVRWKGTINYWPFYVPNGQAWPAGSLLYLGAKALRVFTPPQFEYKQQTAAIDGWQNVLQGTFAGEPLMDVEMSFIATRRTTPAADAIPFQERPNRNWLAAGHNLQPVFFSKRFAYAHSKANLLFTGLPDWANWTPPYLSSPIPLILFLDPDVELMTTL